MKYKEDNTVNWLDTEMGWIIEVDITFRCNLSCLYCNRICNAEHLYNINRSKTNMTMCHIDYLCKEIKKHPIGKIKLIRILGGEPLLSSILLESVVEFEKLLDTGYIKKIQIVTNGTILIPQEIKDYIIFSPQVISDLYNNQNEPASLKEVCSLKSTKHRNITIVPEDYNKSVNICDRVIICGVNYNIYGFSFTAPCLPSMLIFPENNNRFLYQLPKTYRDFIFDDFEKNVCAKCCFAFSKYEYSNKLNDIEELKINNFIGSTWKNQIADNKGLFHEPNIGWLENV